MTDNNPEQLNTHQDRQEYREQKRAAREAEVLSARRKRIFKKITYWVIGVAIVIGGGWLLVRAGTPKGQDYSQAITILGRNHVPDGTKVSYNSNPPTSGNHYAVPASARFYDKELPDEQLVHNLEHGHVWVSFKPGLSAEIVDMLKSFSSSVVIVTPRSANDADIALAAWGRLDKFNTANNVVDEQRIKDFIIRYQGKGPEKLSAGGHFN